MHKYRNATNITAEIKFPEHAENRNGKVQREIVCKQLVLQMNESTNEARILLWDNHPNSQSNVILDRICAYKKECVVAHSSNVSKFHAIEQSKWQYPLWMYINYCRRVSMYTNFILPNHIFVVTLTAQHSKRSHMPHTAVAYYPLCSRHVRHAISRPMQQLVNSLQINGVPEMHSACLWHKYTSSQVSNWPSAN